VRKSAAELQTEDETSRRRRGGGDRRPAPPRSRGEPRRRTGKLTVTEALSGKEDRVRSLASVRRERERERKERRDAMMDSPIKVVREVVVPETITVQELANRMAERGVDVIRVLMGMGVMATVNQVIDADTAELVISEFGHKLRRVAAADVEIGLKGDAGAEENLQSRPPVVTVMGHVDHGKTSLLDAIREADVVSGEAGGITQHIGAYQVESPSGGMITFIDTPGHEAFTAMRARGAQVTDLVILVVAADDGVMPQTIEAINHAKEAGVPLLVAVNKMDLAGADPNRVKQELLQHEVIAEEFGGDIQIIEVSALQKQGLDSLEEAILLQSEMLDLKANPDRGAVGVVVEAKLDRGRGPVATVLVQHGTLKIGDVFVVGSEFGRVRALLDSHGDSLESAGPATPVEVLGLNGAPKAGDEFTVVENEGRAREVADYRKDLERERRAVIGARGTLEQMFDQIQAGERAELPLIIKADVQGTLEAIIAAGDKMGNDEVTARFIHTGVGAITESDVELARASEALIIGFNVRANAQARSAAKQEGIDIRYYAIIYELVDDLRQAMSGLLAPEMRETSIGSAEVLEVFGVSKIGKVAGCRVIEGVVRRDCNIRLLRDDVVVHDGPLKSLKRFKDDVPEVREGTECGVALANYQDIQGGDRLEFYEVEEIERTL
jgi:translation initiation factor IF-2